MENTDDSRRALYERFYNIVGRADTPQDAADAYFDEDDIIEIYDYANDMNDDFIKLEALFYGARMFPGSEALRTRRDYLYYYLGNDGAVRLLLERRKRPTTLSRLLALRARTDRGLPTHDELDAILRDTPEMDDEEIIQFVAEASTPANVDWLFANIDRIRGKCTYLPTLYYELAGAAEDNGDYQRATAMAEELTMLEPFNLEYWELLADVQRVAGDYKGCLVTLGYSLAIDPESVKSKILKATALFNLDHSSAEAIDLLMGVRDSDSFDSTCMQTLAILLTNNRRTEEAVALLEERLAADPSDMVVLDCLFVLNEPALERYMASLRTVSADLDLTSGAWLEWGARHMSGARYAVAAELLLEACRLHRLDGSEAAVAEALYLAGRFDDVTSLHARLQGSGAGRLPEINAAAVMSLARLGRRDEAAALAASFLASTTVLPPDAGSELPSETQITRRFFVTGVKSVFSNIHRALVSPDVIPVDDYDPFIG